MVIKMDEMNRNNIDDYIPQEIPIPGVTNSEPASKQRQNSPYEQSQQPSSSYEQQQPGSSYGQSQQQNSPYEQNQQQNSPYEQSQQPSSSYEQQQSSSPYGQSQQQNSSYEQQQPGSPYEQNQQQNSPYEQNQQQNSPYEQSQQQNGSYEQQQDNPHGRSDHPYRYNPYQNQGGVNGRQFPPYQPGEQKKSIRLLIAAVCVIIALIAVGVGTMAYFRSMPAYKIAKGFEHLGKEIAQVENPLWEKAGADDILLMMAEEGCHVDTKLNFTMEVPFLGNMTLGIDTDFYQDMQAKELSADTSVSVMNYDFAHLNLYADDEVFCFSIPELFMEDMYIENENVVRQYNHSVLADGNEVDMEDFSINLFPNKDERLSMRDWKNFSETFGRLESDLKACKDGMVMEKVEKGLYRVIFPEKETNRLVKDFLKEYGELYQMAEELEDFEEYKDWICSDVSLLFEIGPDNHIEGMTLENPVKMLDAQAEVSGELFLVGETRSLDKVQGKLSVDGVDGRTREIICQVVQNATPDDYQVTMDMKYSDGYSDGKMKYVMHCDAARDELDMTLSLKDEEDSFEIGLEGSLDDIVKGESVRFDLEKIVFSMDEEELFRISGDIDVEPLNSKVKASVEPGTAFFEMTMSDWEDIIYKIDDEYGGLLNALW